MNSKLLSLVIALAATAVFSQQKPAYSDAEAGKHVGEEATVTGRFVNVSISGKGTTFLNLGDRFPRQTFGGVIFASKQARDVISMTGSEARMRAAHEATICFVIA